jgi:mono/diheme cytochrome c family protein
VFSLRASKLLAAAVATLGLSHARPARASQPTTDGPAAGSNPAVVLDTYCISCHGPDRQEGDIRFDALETIDTVDQQDLFQRAQDAVHFEEMPPSGAEQPADPERAALLTWLQGQLTGEAALKLEEKLRRPEAGNYVDHDALFSGKHADTPGFTHDRRWIISEYIFDAKFNRILRHEPSQSVDGTRHTMYGSNNRRVELANPFRLPDTTGVRYYANETLHGGHLATMLSNARNAARKMLQISNQRNDYLPAVNEILQLERSHRESLKKRRAFLEAHVDRLLAKLYGDRHEAMLPDFVSTIKPFDPASLAGEKKPLFHLASPGQDELEIVFRTMVKVDWEKIPWTKTIADCERAWFYTGHHPTKIAAWISLLQKYEAEWKDVIRRSQYREKHTPPPYTPLDDEQMAAIESSLRANRKPGDTYTAIVDRCMEGWEADYATIREDAGPPDDELLGRMVEQASELILEQRPRGRQRDQHIALVRSYFRELGHERGILKMLQTMFLETEFVYRMEFGAGEPDEHGRRMMSPHDASFAIAYALTDQSPDEDLQQAVLEGRLETRADYEREVRRMLACRARYSITDESISAVYQGWNNYDNFTNMPVREHRFFREFFGYPRLMGIFKDSKRFGGNYDEARRRLVTEADRLVETILEEDQNVIEQLLTTENFYVFHTGNNEVMKAASDRIRTIYEYFSRYDWRNFTPQEIRKHTDFILEMQMRGIDARRLKEDPDYDPTDAFKRQMQSFEIRLGKGQAAAAPYNSFGAHGMANAASRLGGQLLGPEVAKFFNIDLADWDYPSTQPTALANRKGMLTHPAWLIAFAGNTETDPIRRGKFIREKLLAGTIPDVPITVDAVIPEDPHKTLRQRMTAKTGHDYCWACHRKMEPLGLPFEIYDDFGRFRTEERLEYPENLVEEVPDKQGPHVDMRNVYKTLPVEATGELVGTGDNRLDGEVQDALDLIERLAKSDRVRQSIIRHAFRYFLGRNETLSDSKTLIDADQAYLRSGGSFDELIVSLLTSDSFIYRKPAEAPSP